MKVIRIIKASTEKDTMYLNPTTIKEFKVPYNNYPSVIEVNNINTFYQNILQELGRAFLQGTKIIIDNNFKFEIRRPIPLWAYQNVYATVSDLKTLKRFVKNPMWNKALNDCLRIRQVTEELALAIEQYNQAQINRVYTHNFNWETLENFYKDFYQLTELGYKVYSPSRKTYYEYTAEKEFEYDAKELSEHTVYLSENEHIKYNYYKNLYDIIPQETYCTYTTTKTDNGYTLEPHLTRCPTETDYNRAQFSKNWENAPRYHRSLATPRNITPELDDVTKAYIDWLLSLPEETRKEFYALDTDVCPICGRRYNTNHGCIDSQTGYYHVEPIEKVTADKLFYGIDDCYEELGISSEYAKTYEDYED